MASTLGNPEDVVLVTGASTGLGLALSRILVDQPERLILTAREHSLERFAAAGITESERVRLRPLDVLDHDQQSAVVEEARRDWGGVDVLINNAGVAYRSVVEHIDDEERLRQMDVNFLSPIELARKVLPDMRAKRRGRILNVSSVSGMMAMPTMAAYSASKWALEGATEALWYEVRPWNVHVTLIEPGFIHSPSFPQHPLHARVQGLPRRRPRSLPRALRSHGPLHRTPHATRPLHPRTRRPSHPQDPTPRQSPPPSPRHPRRPRLRPPPTPATPRPLPLGAVPIAAFSDYVGYSLRVSHLGREQLLARALPPIARADSVSGQGTMLRCQFRPNAMSRADASVARELSLQQTSQSS